MKTTKIFLMPAMLIFLVLLLAFVSASSVTVSLFYDATTSDSLTINYGDSTGVVLSADSIFESSMNVNLNLLDSSGNVITTILDTYQTSDSYSKHLVIDSASYINPGNYVLRGTVIGESGQTDIDNLYLTVLVQTSQNNVPVITSTPVTEINEGQTYTYQVTASDADGDALTYSLTQNPSWLSIDSNGLITGTAPSVNTNTQYSVTIRVSDGKDFVIQFYTLMVRNVPVPPINNVPVITSTPVTEVNENLGYSYQVVANDADGDALTYSLTQNPSWLSISSSGLITGTAPSVDIDTQYSVTARVSDGKDFTTQTYTLVVKNIAQTDTTPPVVTTVSPVNRRTYILSNVLFEITTDENASNAWYNLDNGNDVQMNAASGTIFVLMAHISDGSHFVIFHARDLAGNIGQSSVINFNVNTSIPTDTIAPVVAISYPVNRATYDTKHITVTFTASDLNLNICYYSLNSATNIVTACNADFTITAIEGANTLTIYASDLAGNVGSQTVTFDVDIPSGKKTKTSGLAEISSDETDKYLNQFNPATISEDEGAIILSKEQPSSFWDNFINWLKAIFHWIFG